MRPRLLQPGRRRALQQRIAEVEKRMQGRRSALRDRAGALRVHLRASLTSPLALLIAGGVGFLITRRWIAASRVNAGRDSDGNPGAGDRGAGDRDDRGDGDRGAISWRQFVLVGLSQLQGCLHALGVLESLRSARKSP